jgi:ATP-binding cassette subfamily B protein
MTEERQSSPQDDLSRIRAAMGRGSARPGRIEKARNPRQALVRLALYLRPYTLTIIIVLVFVLAYILLELWEPYLIGVAIDRYISAKQAAGLVHISILLLIVFLFDNGFQAISSWMMARI